MFWALMTPIAAASTASGDRVLIRESDVITEDLYASGNSVVIRGRIEGDLVATSFESIVVEGVVEGDIVALTTQLTISGEVGGSVRGVADQVLISGSVGDDVVVAARTIRISGMVGRDVLSFGYQLTTTPEAQVGRDVRIQMIDHTRLAGSVGGDAEINADRLVVVDGAMIGGDLRYRAKAEVGDVSVNGVSIQLGRVPTPIRVKTLLLLSTALAGLSLVAVTFLVFWLAPTSLRHAIDAASGWRWLRSLVRGVGFIVVPAAGYGGLVIAAGASSPDLAVVALVMLVPFLTAWMAALVLGALVGVVPVAAAIGRRLVPRRSVFVHVTIGLVLVVGGALLPVVGWAVAAVTLLTGLGAWLSGAWNARGARSFEIQPAA